MYQAIYRISFWSYTGIIYSYIYHTPDSDESKYLVHQIERSVMGDGLDFLDRYKNYSDHSWPTAKGSRDLLKLFSKQILAG
jgi:hypothetical protein